MFVRYEWKSLRIMLRALLRQFVLARCRIDLLRRCQEANEGTNEQTRKRANMHERMRKRTRVRTNEHTKFKVEWSRGRKTNERASERLNERTNKRPNAATEARANERTHATKIEPKSLLGRSSGESGQAKIDEKSRKIALGASLGRSWRALGRSLRALGMNKYLEHPPVEAPFWDI